MASRICVDLTGVIISLALWCLLGKAWGEAKIGIEVCSGAIRHRVEHGEHGVVLEVAILRLLIAPLLRTISLIYPTGSLVAFSSRASFSVVFRPSLLVGLYIGWRGFRRRLLGFDRFHMRRGLLI